MRTGQAPVKSLQSVYEAVGRWMHSVYARIKYGTPPAEVRKILNGVYGRVSPETASLIIVLTREQELALVNNDMEAGTQIMKNLEELVVNRYLGNVVIDDISSAKVLIREDSKDDSIEAHGTSPRKVARRMRIR